ncbi:Phox homologous domain-containing protein [Chaetomidium leptoderma]|uniref:Endosomal/vacuolar adapter protein YPT35 n=1 Tax=Chaetomidium leptoderma TaxID=669021 RepID=A0AAN6VQ77_9PEZI|nr:Phox homologous domain-containing protein [Chaetomidium leptoderma]
MASENEQEQHPRQPAQQEQPPESRRHDDDEDSAREEAPVNGTTQSHALPSIETQQHSALFPEGDDDDNASEASIPSDTASEQVISPAASIPPYWSHSRAQERAHLQNHTSGHSRAVSSASAESVLPPGAITLQDNEREDGDDDEYTGRRSNSSELYGRDRNRACWARSVQVTDFVLVNGSTTNIGAFVVWNIRVEALNGSRMNIRKRYSEFDDLRQRLVQTFPNFEAAVPALPPKSVLKRFHPRFLEKRRAGLQYFLNCILLNPEFSGSPVLKEFLFS